MAVQPLRVPVSSAPAASFRLEDSFLEGCLLEGFDFTAFFPNAMK
jgi:hypothetical protein